MDQSQFSSITGSPWVMIIGTGIATINWWVCKACHYVTALLSDNNPSSPSCCHNPMTAWVADQEEAGEECRGVGEVHQVLGSLGRLARAAGRHWEEQAAGKGRRCVLGWGGQRSAKTHKIPGNFFCGKLAGLQMMIMWLWGHDSPYCRLAWNLPCLAVS